MYVDSENKVKFEPQFDEVISVFVTVSASENALHRSGLIPFSSLLLRVLSRLSGRWGTKTKRQENSTMWLMLWRKRTAAYVPCLTTGNLEKQLVIEKTSQ